MMDKINSKFWMVYGIGQRQPAFQHDSKALAEHEAKRLARNNPGVTFVVLEAVSAMIKHDVEVIALRERSDNPANDGMPFEMPAQGERLR